MMRKIQHANIMSFVCGYSVKMCRQSKVPVPVSFYIQNPRRFSKSESQDYKRLQNLFPTVSKKHSHDTQTSRWKASKIWQKCRLKNESPNKLGTRNIVSE